MDESPLDHDLHAFGPWFHNLHLPDGRQTAPHHFLGDFPSYKWQSIAPLLPSRMDGWRVLDVGCNAGFYSIELARRGARVTAIDVNPHYLAQARWAAAQFGILGQIELHRMQVYDLARWNNRFDLVLFLGVFYHLRYPLLGLDIVAHRVGRMMVFQTLTMPGSDVHPPVEDIPFENRDILAAEGWPRMAFIEQRFANDPTNWWAPNHAAVLAMLRSCGMRVVAQPGHEMYVCEPDPANPSCMDTWNADEYNAVIGLGRQPV